MSKRKYYGLIICFIAIFFIGLILLNKQNNNYDLEMWSYYTGGHNSAITYFNDSTEYKMKYTGIAADNYTTKLDAALANGDVPDIVMVDSDDLGRYIGNEQFVDFNQVFANSDKYSQYLSTASDYGLNIGTYNGMQKAIKFENTSSIFVYRSDLAEKCLHITSPNQMQKETSSYLDYTRLYNSLRTSDNEECNKLSLFATNEYTKYLLNPNNVITNGALNPDVYPLIRWVKQNLDTKLVYSRFGQYHELIDKANQSYFLGDITTVNHLREIYDFNQPKKWAVTQTPINYQGNTTYFLINKDANLEAVKQFFESTYFDQFWLANNVNELGIIENEKVMNENNYSAIDLNSYFTNIDLQAELNEAGQKNINGNHDIVGSYDYGIRNTMNGVINDYIDGRLEDDQIKQRIESDLKIFYG